MQSTTIGIALTSKRDRHFAIVFSKLKLPFLLPYATCTLYFLHCLTLHCIIYVILCYPMLRYVTYKHRITHACMYGNWMHKQSFDQLENITWPCSVQIIRICRSFSKSFQPHILIMVEENNQQKQHDVRNAPRMVDSGRSPIYIPQFVNHINTYYWCSDLPCCWSYSLSD